MTPCIEQSSPQPLYIFDKHSIRDSVYLQSLESSLPLERKVEILTQLKRVDNKLKEKRKFFFDKIGEKYRKKIKEDGEKKFFETPAWKTISTTHSPKGYRFTVGLKNIGCDYWRTDPNHLGCFNCGFCAQTFFAEKLSKDQLERQFGNALREVLREGKNFDVVEFLNDGSFFNDTELDEEDRKMLIEKVNKLPYIRRILVESRPKYIETSKIKSLLDLLTDTETLEIGIGLETKDEFIRIVCIRKGFKLDEFEEATQKISEFREKCKIVAYLLVKPAFIKENEAIDDSVETIKYLAEISKKNNIEIIPKLEPTVVLKGTLLDVLYFDEKTYKPPSTWSIIEIIARTHLLGLDKNIRIGAREDMGIICKMPGVYDDSGMLNKFDFILYEASQRFQYHHNIKNLLADISEALKNTSFQKWKEHLGIDEPAISKCYKKYENETSIHTQSQHLVE